MQHTIRQCQNDTCAFRFPVSAHERGGAVCPACGAPTQAMLSYTSAIAPPPPPPTGPPVAALLDNLRSVFNVGSIFRTSDGAGVRHLYLGGTTPTPAHPKLAKTALTAESALDWSYERNSVTAARRLQAQGYRVWALESHPQAVSVFDRVSGETPVTPVLLIVGNEVSGVDPALLALCERIVFIPMLGSKESLNVATAFGIVVYQLRFGRITP